VSAGALLDQSRAFGEVGRLLTPGVGHVGVGEVELNLRSVVRCRAHLELLEDVVDPSSVTVGIETDRGLWVRALAAARYGVVAINPMQVSRYRERYSTSGAKSDAGDARMVADIVRLEADRHRPVAGDSHLVEAIEVLARAHQSLVWSGSGMFCSCGPRCGTRSRLR
jgi:hypothetical protein